MNSVYSKNIRTRLLGGAGILVLITLCGLVLQKTRVESFEMETAHLAVLEPHEHGPEDSVSDEWHHQIISTPVIPAPRDLYVTGIHYELANAPTSTVHHMSLTDTSRKNLTCPNFPTGAELFSYSADRMYDNDISLPDGYALLIPKGTPLEMYLMLHNPEPPVGPGGTYKDVYTRVRFLETSADPHSLKLVTPYLLHLDDVPCAYGKADGSEGVIFSVPARRLGYTYSGKGIDDPAAAKRFETGATLVDLTGHLHAHQGGRELIVHRNEDILHIFRPATSTDPYVAPLYRATSTFHVNAGDTVWLSAVYDNPTEFTTRGAMGAVGFYYVAD
jgi:hypothetical protein